MEQRPKNIDFFTSRRDMDLIFDMSKLLGQIDISQNFGQQDWC